MKNGRIRIGIIGTGNIAQNAHVPAYLANSDLAELVGVCDLNEKRAKEVAEKYEMKYAVTDFHDLINQDDIDAISICTWNDTHAEATIAAAKAGKHILCEKPMATSPEEAEAMMQAAEENNVVFMMGFVNRFKAGSKLIKDLADAGKFGELYYGRALWRRRRGTPLGWFTSKTKSGGGPVIDIGVHVIDLTWYLMGKPKPVSISASTYSKIGDYQTKGVSRWEAFDTDDLVFETEDSAAGFIRFENGASISFDVSWAINGQDTGMNSEIFGVKGGANLNPLTIYSEEENYLMDSTPIIKDTAHFNDQIRHFLNCIKEGKKPIADARDGYYVQKMLNGIYDSARAGKEIKLT